MDCETKWTIRFKQPFSDGYVRYHPVQLTATLNRSEYDFCRAKFPINVGEDIRPNIYPEDDPRIDGLEGYTIVYLERGEETIRTLLMKPDWIRFGREYTHMQLRDLQWVLKDADLDFRGKVDLNNIYENLLKFVPYDVYDGVEYYLPEKIEANLQRFAGIGGPVNEEALITGESEEEYKADLDFEDTTVEKAIQKVNEIFSIHTWTTSDRKLGVGVPENARHQNLHIAAPNDERVWRYKDPQITYAREPIKRCFVEGQWYDNPGWDIVDGIKEVKKNVFGKKGQQGGADVQAVGVAERTDIATGKSFSVTNKSVQAQSLKTAAKKALIERIKETNLGSVEIDVSNSGTEVSDPTNLKPGDAIRLVPHDKHFDNPDATSGAIGDAPDPEELCAGFVSNRNYFVNEVEHNVAPSGHYSAHADLTTYPNMEIRTKVVFWDPSEEEFLEDRESGSWFLSESTNEQLPLHEN